VTAPPPAPAEIALVQVGVAGVLVALLAILFEPHAGAIIAVPVSWQAWFSVAWLGVLGSGVAYLLYFRILRSVGRHSIDSCHLRHANRGYCAGRCGPW